jgi:hypothetical protein
VDVKPIGTAVKAEAEAGRKEAAYKKAMSD